MASSANSHVAFAGAGTTPSDSPHAARKAGGGAVWSLPESAPVPAAVDTAIWPELPRLASPSPAAAVAKSSPKAAPSPSTGEVMSPVSLGNPSALDANPDNEAAARNPADRHALVMPAGDALEKSTPSPELSPVYVPNTRSNGGDHHQNGHFSSHPHGRGGNYGGGNRRGNGGGGGRRGHDHHGGFDGQRRGGGGRRGGHGSAHQHRGHQPMYIRAPLAVVAGGPPPPPQFPSPATPQTPPYPPHMGFPDIAQTPYYFVPEGIQGFPFTVHPASPQAILIDPVRKELMDQIDYYFSDDNLCKDIFLRQHMDDQGWVPVSLIAGFRQVKKLTNSIQIILETVMLSTVVEVQGDKIRRRGTWESWLLPKQSYSAGTSSGSMPPVTSNTDSLGSQFQSIGLEGATYYTRSTSSVSLGYTAPVFIHNNGSGPYLGTKPSKSLMRSDTF